MGKIKRSFRNIGRFFTITRVFISLLIDMFLQRIHFPTDTKKSQSKIRAFWGKFFAFIFRRDVKKIDYPVIFREALERLGPTFVKLGQIISLRKDFIPEELCTELEKLQDKVPSMKFEDVSRTIEIEFRKPIDEVFNQFERVPLAAASLSQIHVAYLDDGTKVAVKVQRKGIRRIIYNDINILKSLANIMEKLIRPLRHYQLPMFIKEFETYTIRELDFKVEGFHAEKFSANFSNNPDVNFPKIYWEKTTSKVLTMQFIDGIKPKEAKELDEYGIDRKQMAKIATNAVLQMLFIDGFFHGDPHPGNILITKDQKMYFIDLGMIGKFSEKIKNYMFLYYYYMNLGDFDNAVKNFIRLLRTTPKSDLNGFKEELVERVSSFSEAKLEDVSFAQFIIDTLQIGVKYKVYFPGDTFLMSKSLITIESIGTMLLPGLKINEITKPFTNKIFIEKFGFDNIAKSFARSAPDIIELIKRLPEVAIRTIKRVEKGQHRIHLTNQRKAEKISKQNTSVLSRSILIGVFTLCGTLFVDYYTNKPDSTVMTKALNLFGQDIPVFGAIFFGLAIILALSLLFTSRKDK